LGKKRICGTWLSGKPSSLEKRADRPPDLPLRRLYFEAENSGSKKWKHLRPNVRICEMVADKIRIGFSSIARRIVDGIAERFVLLH
jgi:hypothetical protein